MRYKQQSPFFHALQMVRRNFQRYAMLSVTVVLSFSLLLGYLCFMDSMQYNRYKELFKQPGNIVLTSTDNKKDRLNALDKMVERVDPNAKKYVFFNYNGILQQYGRVYTNLYFLPKGRTPVYIQQLRYLDTEEYGWSEAAEATLLLGRDTFELNNNEAIISENLYEALGGEKEFPFELPVSYREGNHTTVVMLSVVGVCADSVYDSQIQQQEQTYIGQGSIFTTQAIQEEYFAGAFDETTQIVWYCTDYPEEIAGCIDQLGLIPTAVCLTQNQARQNICTQNTNKLYTVLGLLLILGINLFSSFSNALSERKYEIGVKRAIGASPRSIILQFLLESLFLMLFNIFIAVVIVSDVLIIYKFIQWAVEGYQWVVYVSPYSIAMFAVCSVSITVAFSGLFAYKASKVEIIKHLKME